MEADYEKNDFYNLEEQIINTIKNAFEVIEFSKINENINKTEKTIKEVKKNIYNKTKDINGKFNKKVKEKYRNFDNIKNNKQNGIEKYIAKRPVGSIAWIFYMIFGSIGSFILGISLILYAIYISFKNQFLVTEAIGLVVIFAFFATSIGIVFKGISLRKRVKKFKEYIKYIEEKKYCSIEELALSMKVKNKTVLKDLKKMIELRMFTQGHIDNDEQYFMLNDEIYRYYLESQDALKRQREQNVQSKEEDNTPIKAELKEMIQIGEEYIKQIKVINNNIDNKAMLLKLDRHENIVNQIIKYVEKNPNKIKEVHKFINHYLPITLKLIKVYNELNEQPVQGENIKNSKYEIEKTIDTINIAFENLFDDLFEEIAIDVSTDISVLETLFTQEGLTENDFKNK